MVTAQLIFGMLADNYGWFGFQVNPISYSKVFGAALLLAGVFLMGRK
jgi:uncharacterized membrane protein YdcZ (DUF606 family)